MHGALAPCSFQESTTVGAVDFFHREFREKRLGFPDLLRYDSCISPGVVLGKGGELISTFRYRGPDMQCASKGEIGFLRQRANDMYKKLAEGWMVHSTTLRVESVNYEDNGAFPDPVTRAIEDERVQQYRTDGAHYENDFYITFTFLPDPILINKVTAFAFDTTEKNTTDPIKIAAKSLDYFERTMADYVGILETGMSSRLVRLMPRQEIDPYTHREVWYEDHLAFLQECLTGQSNPVRVPHDAIPFGVDYLIGSCAFNTGIRPTINGTHIRVVAIEGLPDEGTLFGLLEYLNQFNVKFRWTTRWIARDPEKAKASTTKVRSKWRQKIRGFVADAMGKQGGAVNQDAVDMSQDAEIVLTDLSSGAVSYGFWTSTVILMGDDAGYLESAVRYFLKQVSGLGFPCRDEDVNCVEAFLGSLPGHGYENVRMPEIHSMNLADCLPLTSIWQGPVSNPCPFYKKYFPNQNVPPLFQGSSSGGTPFRVVLHNGDLAHTFIGGPPGAGKSTLLCLMAASHFRYPDAKVFAFEKGESMMALCLAAGGKHYGFMDDTNDGSTKIGLAPFVQIDRQSDRTWAADYVESILELNGVTVDHDVRKEINRVLTQLQTRPVHLRTFTHFNQLVQIRHIKEVLMLYEHEMAGGMLNAAQDTITSERFTVFEMEKLMEAKNTHVAPVLLYIFRMIERALDGSPTMIILDEAWLMLGHKMFADKLREWFKVLRKANAFVVFATQELQDVADSPIAATIFSSCQTKILLPNATANSDENRPLYKSIGLTDREIELLANGRPKQDYFFTSPAGRRLFQLELGPVALAFVAASGKDDRLKVKELCEIHGDRWVSHWLELRGLSPDIVSNANMFRKVA
jgi:type IV secretion/conjugal transfer VirB4 family ATPase